jgi:hypothetical protein
MRTMNLLAALALSLGVASVVATGDEAKPGKASDRELI